jgi:LmbE family N-acetylglucosaminyl deacetylase
MIERVLAVVAHPDDEVLGCGGALARHAIAGQSVQVMILGTGITARGNEQPGWVDALRRAAVLASCEIGSNVTVHNLPDQRFDSLDLLDIVRLIEAKVAEYKPEVVYTHHSGDLNRDHRITHEAVLVACRPVGDGGCVKRILGCETLSSTEWGMDPFWPSVFVGIAGEPFTRKSKALGCYGSEMRPFPHSRSMECVEALAKLRGAQAGITAAEAFQLVREVR